MERTNDRLNRKELKERIIHVASEAFRKHGIKKVTMDEIASLLKISKRTLYEVFSDKESLLVAIIIERHVKNREFTEEICEASSNVLEVILRFLEVSISYLQHTNKKVFSDLKKYPEAYKVMLEFRANEAKRKIDFYQLGVEQGLFRNDINFGILTLLVDEQFDLLLNTDVCNAYSFVEVFESISFTFIRGIATEKGARLLDEFIVKYNQKTKTAIKENK